MSGFHYSRYKATKILQKIRENAVDELVTTYRYLHSSSEKVFSTSKHNSGMVDRIDLGPKELKRHLSSQTLQARSAYVGFDEPPNARRTLERS